MTLHLINKGWGAGVVAQISACSFMSLFPGPWWAHLSCPHLSPPLPLSSSLLSCLPLSSPPLLSLLLLLPFPFPSPPLSTPNSYLSLYSPSQLSRAGGIEPRTGMWEPWLFRAMDTAATWTRNWRGHWRWGARLKLILPSWRESGESRGGHQKRPLQLFSECTGPGGHRQVRGRWEGKGPA